MLLSTQIRRAELMMLALQFITAVVGIWLLGRTAPAIEKILAENVATLEAVHEMQRGLAQAQSDPEAGRARFEKAHQRAVHNITEPREREVLSTIDEQAEAAFARGAAPGSKLSNALADLARVNRDSMEQADHEAKAIATAGAWSLVGLALATVMLSLVFVRRTNARVVAPVHHLHEVTAAYERGETMRRCQKFGMPDELRFVAETINRLFDAEVRHKKAEQLRTRRTDVRHPTPEALTALLASIPNALVLLDEDGAPLACTEAATPRLRELVTGAVRLGAKSRASADTDPNPEVELDPEVREAADEDIELRELPGAQYLILEKSE